MNRFTKICLIGAVVFLILGLGFLFGGIAAGGSWSDVVNAADRGDFVIYGMGIGRDKNSSDVDDHEDIEYDSYDFHESEKNIHSGSGDYDSITKLDVEIKRGGFYLTEGDSDVIEVEITGEEGKRPTVSREGNELKIRDNNKDYRSYKGSVTIYCPENMEFDKVDISVEGGEAVIDVPLTAKKIDVELGAGLFESSEQLTAAKSSWQVGAGEVILESIEGNKIDFECGAGTITANINGKESDYNYEIECAVGEVRIGETTIAGVGQKRVKNTASDQYKIDAECGMGTIEIDFEK